MRVIFWQGPVLTEVINPTQALSSAFHRFLMNPSWVVGALGLRLRTQQTQPLPPQGSQRAFPSSSSPQTGP